MEWLMERRGGSTAEGRPPRTSGNWSSTDEQSNTTGLGSAGEGAREGEEESWTVRRKSSSPSAAEKVFSTSKHSRAERRVSGGEEEVEVDERMIGRLW